MEPGSLPEGAEVTILAMENGETFELAPEQESELLAAIDAAERGEWVMASEVLEEIRRP